MSDVRLNFLIKRDTYITISFVITIELSLYDNKFLAIQKMKLQ
jgi:hypothetical protein